jgi:pimeloyl-ACP methyl ester carboxylesterase
VPSPAEHIEAHRAAGRTFEAGGLRSFVREEGDGPPVLLMHGVPTSSYLYRKVLPALAARGRRAVAFDLVGLGLADRPDDFDYSWTGLGAWCAQAVDALELSSFHLVIHDLGAPVALEMLARSPGRATALTILNSPIKVDGFTKPWTMRPFEGDLLGRLWLGSMTEWMFVRLMYLQGVSDRRKAPPDELAGHFHLLKSTDGGRAFLKIMKGFETTAEKEALYLDAIRAVPRERRQLVWGARDPVFTPGGMGEHAKRAAEVDELVLLPGKHFPQEDCFEQIAEHVAQLTG